MDEIKKIETIIKKLENSLNKLVQTIGPIRIGEKRQFPYGWRKAKKGRTVWRIIEEIITQNLEKYHENLNLIKVEASQSDVSVYDMECEYTKLPTSYINIKSAVVGGRKNKDDISKATKLIDFYNIDPTRNIFIATFFLSFQDDMSVKITNCVVFPLAWIPDIYVNPSNNGNLQSKDYKDISKAIKRTNSDFIALLKEEILVANRKRKKQN